MIKFIEKKKKRQKLSVLLLEDFTSSLINTIFEKEDIVVCGLSLKTN